MKTPFTEYEGTFYVSIAASGIHPLIPYIDGMRVTLFGRSRKGHLPIDEAIKWHEKELEVTNGEFGSTKVLNLLREARRRFMAGKVVQEGVDG